MFYQPSDFFTINLKKHYSFYSIFVVVEKKAENIIIRDGEQDEKNDDDDSTRWWSCCCCLQEKVHLHSSVSTQFCMHVFYMCNIKECIFQKR